MLQTMLFCAFGLIPSLYACFYVYQKIERTKNKPEGMEQMYSNNKTTDKGMGEKGMKVDESICTKIENNFLTEPDYIECTTMDTMDSSTNKRLI